MVIRHHLVVHLPQRRILPLPRRTVPHPVPRIVGGVPMEHHRVLRHPHLVHPLARCVQELPPLPDHVLPVKPAMGPRGRPGRGLEAGQVAVVGQVGEEHAPTVVVHQGRGRGVDVGSTHARVDHWGEEGVNPRDQGVAAVLGRGPRLHGIGAIMSLLGAGYLSACCAQCGPAQTGPRRWLHHHPFFKHRVHVGVPEPMSRVGTQMPGAHKAPEIHRRKIHICLNQTRPISV
mmetsp:Transcript_87125/g.198860  ORF Transcript_87125/g.198860 Transcript_87125/m.198860 type:complete len:231 (-) Transcript_87125:379-1071(-)